MTKVCTLELKDECNVKCNGLDVTTRRKISEELKFFLPYARHVASYKLGRWDGMVRFCDIGGRTYINLLDKVLPIIVDGGYEIQLDDRRKTYAFDFDKIDKDSYSHIKWPEGHPKAGEPIELREHQVDLVNDLLPVQQGMSICPTAGGKTVSTAILSHKAEKYGRTIVIVPTKDLVVQTEEDYINMGLDVGVFYGDRKDWGKMHTICTWQSLEALNKLGGGLIDDFVEDVICVICDEVHKAKADVLRKLLTGPFANVPIRWGVTGTLPEEDHEKIAVLASIGKVQGIVKASDLQEKGYLANLHIDILQYDDPIVSFSDYQTELAWLSTDKDRLEAISKKLSEIAKTGNTLILVDRVKTGEILSEYLSNSIFISGNVKSTKRKEEYKSVQFSDNKTIIATYGVASTGININRIFNLVLLEPGKSFVRVIQSIGRGLRVADDKDFVNVFDITSTCKFSKRHLTKRKRFYKEAEYPFKVKKIIY